MTELIYRCPRRWGDLDAQGHVNNALYIDYLQEARVHFLLSGPPVMHRLLDDGVLVVSHQMEYLAPVEFSIEPLSIRLWVDAIGGSRFVIGYDVSDGERLVGRARTALAPYDLRDNRLRRLKPEERAVLTEHLAPAESLRAIPRVPLTGVDCYRYPLTVRWSDLDSYGHVNNVKYYEYLQEARVDWWVRSFGWADGEIRLVVRQDVEYLRPLDFRLAPYEVRIGVSAIGSRSFTVEAEIADPADGTRYATGRTVIVSADPLTDEQRSRLATISD